MMKWHNGTKCIGLEIRFLPRNLSWREAQIFILFFCGRIVEDKMWRILSSSILSSKHFGLKTNSPSNHFGLKPFHPQILTCRKQNFGLKSSLFRAKTIHPKMTIRPLDVQSTDPKWHLRTFNWVEIEVPKIIESWIPSHNLGFGDFTSDWVLGHVGNNE